jgi:hypothetical protein
MQHQQEPEDIRKVPFQPNTSSLPLKVLESYNSKAMSYQILNLNNSLKYTDFCKLATLKVKFNSLAFIVINDFK